MTPFETYLGCYVKNDYSKQDCRETCLETVVILQKGDDGCSEQGESRGGGENGLVLGMF